MALLFVVNDPQLWLPCIMMQTAVTRTAKGEFVSPEEQSTFFGACRHAGERSGHLKGARRWQATLRVYALNTNATLKALQFDAETFKYKHLLARSKFNNERQEMVVWHYAKSILSGGAVEHCCSQWTSKGTRVAMPRPIKCLAGLVCVRLARWLPRRTQATS